MNGTKKKIFFGCGGSRMVVGLKSWYDFFVKWWISNKRDGNEFLKGYLPHCRVVCRNLDIQAVA